MSRVGLEVEAKVEIRDRDKNSTSAGLATLQAGVGALSRAVHSQSRRQTSVRARPDLPRVESAKKSKQIPRSEIETANTLVTRDCEGATEAKSKWETSVAVQHHYSDCTSLLTSKEQTNDESAQAGRARGLSQARAWSIGPSPTQWTLPEREFDWGGTSVKE